MMNHEVFNSRHKTVKRPDGTEVKTPSIPITLFGNNSMNFKTIALIDSGADVSVVSKDIAELLNLDLNKEKHFAFGIGGKVEVIETSININIEKDHESYNLTIPIKVILENYDFPVLLGREGFFDEFLVTFNQILKKVILKKIENN